MFEDFQSNLEKSPNYRNNLLNLLLLVLLRCLHSLYQ